ncbi:MAG: helix-turn-helix domain-containing protein, partial [Deltaproteobacteria bacterium]|nr:helix-turn-helix domain-containing protein [Deltaproteobacteria bacterium]
MSTSTAIDTNFWNAIQNTTLTLPARVVLAAIRFRSYARGYCWPRQSTLAGWCGLSLGQVKRAIKELRDAGLIIVKSRGFLRGLEYHPVLEPQNKLCGSEKPAVARQLPTLKTTAPGCQRPNPPGEVVVTRQEVMADSIEVTSVPLKSTSELETPIEGSPVDYIKGNVLIRKKQTDIHPEPALLPPLPATPVSSVSLTPMINCFEDIVKWADSTCMSCGDQTELILSMVNGLGKKDDLTNLNAVCPQC